MSASTKALLTTRESKTGKTGNSSSQANKISRSPPINSPVDRISFLQRTIGNREAERLLKSGVIQANLAIGRSFAESEECEECKKKQQLGLQTKLKINEPGDVYEREADRIAEQVLAAPAYVPIG